MHAAGHLWWQYPKNCSEPCRWHRMVAMGGHRHQPTNVRNFESCECDGAIRDGEPAALGIHCAAQASTSLGHCRSTAGAGPRAAVWLSKRLSTVYLHDGAFAAIPGLPNFVVAST